MIIYQEYFMQSIKLSKLYPVFIQLLSDPSSSLNYLIDLHHMWQIFNQRKLKILI